MGRKKLNWTQVGMIFDCAKKLCDDSLDLRLSSDDNVKSAGPL
jgi:hypothetical protein